jgi:dienelactone hydrolase
MLRSGVVEYKHNGYECEGFAVWDDASAKRPGILVFPEWVGVGEYTHKRAQMLGDLGFNAFVVDVYGKGIRPNTPETCEAEMMKYATNRPLLRQRARCGLDQLRKVPNTDLSKMAAIGYCFGGLAVLEMARDRAERPGWCCQLPWGAGDADATQARRLSRQNLGAARS